MTDNQAYFDYLRKRSLLGKLYRRFILYPRLCRYAKGRTLDVGCGLGDMLAYRPGTVGVDINDKTVTWCRLLGLEAELMEPDILPFMESSFESVILDNVLEHLQEPQPLLAEIRRVLSPGGLLIAGVPGRKGYASDPDHKIFYDKTALIAVMAQAGFLPRKLFPMPLPGSFFDTHMRQFCWYGVFARDKYVS